MTQNEKFDDILNECLDRMLKGETVEQCLQSYPEQAQELEPLLRTAMAARAASCIQPRPEFRARARYEFQSALRDMEAKKSQRRSIFNWRWQWQPAWSIALTAVVIMVLAGGGTVAASRNSMPDNFLYPVKIAAENVQIAVTFSEVDKVELNARFAEKRTEEIVYIAGKGDPQEVQIVAQRMNSNLYNINRVIGAENLAIDSASQDYRSTFAATPADGPEIMMGAASAPAPTQAPEAGPANEPPPAATSEPSVVMSALPEPTETPVPSPGTRMAPQIPIVPGPTSKAALEAPNGDASIQMNDASKPDKWEQMRQIITQNFNNRQALLEEALNQALPEVRPAIRQAIAQSIVEYEKAIMGLEIAQNNQ